MSLRACAAIVVLALSSVAHCQNAGQNYALVIGINKYQNFPPAHDVLYGDQDALGFAEIIESTTGFQFDAANVHVLVGEKATFKRIREELLWLSKHKNANRVYVFFSGHGILDESGYVYFMPWDSDPEMPRVLGIRADYLLEDLKQISARELVLFIDACHAASVLSGGVGKGGSNVSDALLSVFHDEKYEADEDVRMVFLSSGNNEYSYEDPDAKQGIFTHFLIAGMKGAADSDHDGIVTAAELFGYLQDKVPKRAQQLYGSKKPQTPSHSPEFKTEFEFATNLHSVIIDVSGPRSSLSALPREFRASHIGIGSRRISSGHMRINNEMVWYTAEPGKESLVFELSEIQEARENGGFPSLKIGEGFHIKLKNGLSYDFQYVDNNFETQHPAPILHAIDYAVQFAKGIHHARPTDYRVKVVSGRSLGSMGTLHIGEGTISFRSDNDPDSSFDPVPLTQVSIKDPGKHSDIKLEIRTGGKSLTYSFSFQIDIPQKRLPADEIREAIEFAKAGIPISMLQEQPVDRRGKVFLPVNTQMTLLLIPSLCSATAEKGAPVNFEVVRDVIIDNYIAIAKGARGKGVLMEAKHPKPFGRRGFLKIRVDEVELADGQTIALHGVIAAKGAGRGQDAANAAQGFNRLNPLLGIFVYVAMPGQEVGIQAGKPVTAFTAQEAGLDPAKLRAPRNGAPSDAETILSSGGELAFTVIHLRTFKRGNPGLLKINDSGATFTSQSEDEHAVFSSDSIKSVGEQLDLTPCGITGLVINLKKQKRYVFAVFDNNWQPLPPYEAQQALEWLMAKRKNTLRSLSEKR